MPMRTVLSRWPLALLAALVGCGGQDPPPETAAPPAPTPSVRREPAPPPLSKPAPPASVRRPRARPALDGVRGKIVAAARREVARKGGYDSKYLAIKYPGGDVPGGGVCTDLVVRALRGAGYDLQKLIHEDMTANFSEYPQNWELSEPDANIDHRRVPNMTTFFARKGSWLPKSARGGGLAGWKPGDVVFWDLGRGGRMHCGVISDKKAPSGRPLVIHNLTGAAEEDCLTRWKITGHGRYPQEAALDPDSEPAKG